MKNLLSVLTLATVLVFATANEVKAQTTFGNAGLDVALPVGDWAKDVYGLGVGGSGGIELGLSDKFAITANVGITFLTVDSDLSDFIKSAWLAPIQVGARYYLDEQRSGLFLEGKVGVHILGFSTEDFGPIEGESNTETYFSVAPQVGYFLNENISIALKYNLFFVPEDEAIGSESDTGSYIGLKLGYNF
jgi:hypothetical protein